MSDETYLVTGAGTGFGRGIAFGLARLGKTVIAGVETLSEVSMLLNEADERGIELRVEKLDITDPLDRAFAATWDVDVLLNNAGVSLGGALVDIPERQIRRLFEVNVFGTILLTQQIARKMLRNRTGRIVFMSSVHGLMADPFSGLYAASKFALEAFAEAMRKELQEFGIEVATINPGPFLTGFNDREYEAWKRWPSKPDTPLYDYEKLAFPYVQLDPTEAMEESVKVLIGERDTYRNVIPKAMETMAKKRQKELWELKVDDGLGTRNELIDKAYEMEPGTTPTRGVVKKIKEIVL